jgi:hypothetical protein
MMMMMMMMMIASSVIQTYFNFLCVGAGFVGAALHDVRNGAYAC